MSETTKAPNPGETAARASGNDATSSPDAVAQWLWEKVGKK